jgi:hypothetical protein
MRDIDRRSALLQGVTAAALTGAALSMPSTAASDPQSAQPSPLFQEYLRRRQEVEAFFALPEAKSEAPEWTAREEQMHDYLGDVLAQLKARKPGSFGELVELARAAMVEMDPLSSGQEMFDFERPLAVAVLALAGGANGQ